MTSFDEEIVLAKRILIVVSMTTTRLSLKNKEAAPRHDLCPRRTESFMTMSSLHICPYGPQRSQTSLSAPLGSISPFVHLHPTILVIVNPFPHRIWANTPSNPSQWHPCPSAAAHAKTLRSLSLSQPSHSAAPLFLVCHQHPLR